MTTNIAVYGDQAYPFEHGPGTTAYLPHDPAAPLHPANPVVELPDGRLVEQFPLSKLESVFTLEVFQLMDKPLKPDEPFRRVVPPEMVDTGDPQTGYLAPDAETKLVQVRKAPPPERRRPHLFPHGLRGDDTMRCDPQPVIDAAHAAITALAPPNWTALTLECVATMRRIEVAATVAFVNGEVRSWVPPAMVSQWLHRMRMREYKTTVGVWTRLALEFTPDVPVVTLTRGSAEKLEFLLSSTVPDYHDRLELVWDELRLLPTMPQCIHPRMLEDVMQLASMRNAGQMYAAAHDEVPPPDPGGRTEAVRLFDGVDSAGKPVWYRPRVGYKEQDAVVHYLEQAPLVLWSRGMTNDVIAEQDEPTVPLGFHTDGRWVWPSAVAYYLREHGIPPVLELVDHIRQNRYQLPDEIPRIALSRADAVAKGIPWDESSVDQEFADAMNPVYDTIARCQTSPRFYSLGEHKNPAWCLVRDGDWYSVYWADAEGLVYSRMRFGDVRNAAAYLIGQLESGKSSLGWGADEEIPWWQSPTASLSDVDPPLSDFPTVMSTRVTDLAVSRYGAMDGNMVFALDTPPEQCGYSSEQGELAHHRYVLTGEWWVMTGVSAAGGRMYLLPGSVIDHLRSGFLEEIADERAPGVGIGQPAAGDGQFTPGNGRPVAAAPEAGGSQSTPGNAGPVPDNPAAEGETGPNAEPPLPEGHPGLPPVTDAARAEARRFAGGWLWCADPDIHPGYIDGAPDFTLLGAYKVDDEGNLTGEKFINDTYRPGPTARGFPEAHSEFEFVLNYIAAGWLPQERILSTVLENDVIVETDGTGGLRVGVHQNGTRFLVVWSSPQLVPQSAQAPRAVPGRSLLPVLAGTTVVVNPDAVMGIEIPGDDLIAAAR
ncbi:hypothetical protein [Actinokineospora iranica]|uniref:SseB protein N-terminal domain-containing protein n=1 Tax=Actinokineospora iranica TaxID=1271860 RepID=A0A1G6JVG8_9PSEU|nr:hypothetical protein [Actinokineospora iranica]SDC22740.1 hypothetical protein SAMN05216174_101581 [Actinokineospora iranica]